MKKTEKELLEHCQWIHEYCQKVDCKDCIFCTAVGKGLKICELVDFRPYNWDILDGIE